MHSILQNNLAEVVGLLKTHRVEKAFAFGSVCTADFNEDSDIDLLSHLPILTTLRTTMLGIFGIWRKN